MRLLRSDSVYKRRKDQKLRNKLKGKKKHKKLDAIYEKGYSKNHRGVQKVDSVELENAGNEFELRRSGRARKAPVFLDSSPVAQRKRRKVDIGSVEKVKRVDRAECEMACSNSRDGDGEIDGWRSRMRPRQKSNGFFGRVSGESSLKGKRKLLQDLDTFEDCNEPQFEKKEHLMVEKSMVVKSKRLGRVEASNTSENDNQEGDLGGGLEDGVRKNGDDSLKVMEAEGLPLENENQEVDWGGGLEGHKQKTRDGILEVMDKAEGLPLANGNQEVDLGGGLEDGKQENRDDILEVTDKAEGFPLEKKSEFTSEIGVDCNTTPRIAKEKEIAVHHAGFKECHSNGDVEITEEQEEIEKVACDVVPEPGNVAELDRGIADQVKYDGHPENLLEDDIDTKPEGEYKAATVADRKPRIKLGRRCGLCGGGTDGKPPKILVLEGAGSDNEAYSGSSSAEDPNYDVWDGFGDQPGWLGRLLGPINDKFGIAGIWVHQQCAVWSPEVYFAGLGCLKNVRAALYRGRVLKCSRCKRPGATIGCRVDRCPKTYHLPCARAKNCTFDHRKFLIACNDHRYLFQPYGLHNAQRMKKMKAKKLKLELRKMSNDSYRKDIDAEEKWLENCGEDEEFLKRESKRLQRDLWRIAPTYIGGANSEQERQFTGWESVAGLQHVIQCMKEVVILPLLYPEFFNNLGLTPPRGVLLHGYPGTGKTLVVRALVGSCARGDRRIAYFARKGADCLGKYVGDAERQLRLLFQVAEKSQPSIIFFDEIDGLAPARTKQQDQTHNSVVSTLLALMDGVKSRGSVIVIGATNRPDAVDPALRRPGRFDREIYFPLPSLKDREAILSLHTQKWPKPIAGSLLKCVAQRTVGYAGADLQSLCTQAAICGLRRSFPLQKVLSEAETNNAGRRCPAIPIFSVEERDWLKALSCASPPCSQRESGTAVNDVVSSPLKSHLVSSLLQPLTQLLVCLSLDERVWLPSHLKKASKLVKNAIISALDDRQVHSDNWWLQVDGLLQKVEVRDEIEKNLLLANFLVGETNLSSSNALDKDTEERSETIPIKNLCMGASTALSQEMSCVSSSKSGFQVLVCGNPRSGQRHLASSFLNCFVGNVDVWKLDLASISHEGHGDMVHGLTRILMRSSGANFSMLYMPLIDLWAVETYDKSSEDECEPSEVDMEHAPCPSAHVENVESQTVVRKASYLWTSFMEQVESVRVNSSLIMLATAEMPFSLLPDRIRLFFGNEILNCSLSSALGYKVPRFSVQLDGEFDHDKVISSFASKLTNDLAQQVIHSLHGGNHVDIKFSEVKDCKMVDGDASQVCHSKPCHGSPVGVTNKTVKGKSNLQLAISTFGYQILCYPHFAELCWFTSKLKEGPCANASGPWKGWPFNACIVRPINSTEDVTAASSASNIKSKEYSSVRGLLAVGLSAYRGEYNSLREVCSAVRKVLEAIVRLIDAKIQAGKDRTQFIRLLSQVAYLEDMVSSWAHALQSLEVETHIPEANTNVVVEPFDNHVSRDIRSEAHIPEVEAYIAEGNTNAFVEPLDNHVSGGIFSEAHIPEANANAFVEPVDNHVSGDIFYEAHIPEANANAFVEPVDNHVSGGIFSEANIPGANTNVFVEPFDNHVSRDISSEVHIPEVEAHIPEANTIVFVEPLDSHVPSDIFSEAGGRKIVDLNVNIHDSQVLDKSSQEVGLVNAGHSNPIDLDNDCADVGHEIAVTVEEPPYEAVLDDTSSLEKILEPIENIESSTAEATGDHTEPEHAPSTKLPNGLMESSSYSHTENCILSEDINQTSGGSNLNVDDSSVPKSPKTSSVPTTCFYQCCSECFVTLRNLLLRIINTEWKSKGSQSTVEDVHDFLASLSANLHLSLSKLCQDEISCGVNVKEGGSSRKLCTHHKVEAADMPDHKNSDKFLMADCECHTTSREEADCRFVLKDGVPADLDSGTDVSYHCKYEKLCLCFLIEWLVTSKEALG